MSWHVALWGPVILLGAHCITTVHARKQGVGPSRHARLKGQDELWQLGPGGILCGKPLGGQRGAGVGDAALGQVTKHCSSASLRPLGPI